MKVQKVQKVQAPLSGRGIAGFALTTAATAGLLLLLFVRLLNAGHAVNASSGSPLVGRAAPGFTVAAWNGAAGQKIALASLKGKPVVVNFWASWCEPCQEEAPILEAAARKYAPQGVVFVGIAYEDTQKDGVAWLQQHGITYLAGPDTDGGIAVAYGVTGVPETAFIGRDGKVTFKFGGAIDDGTLAHQIQALLK